MKKVLAILAAALMLFAIGCKKEDAATAHIGALKGPTGLGLAYMMQQEATDRRTIELFDAPDAITGKFISGELDIAAVPINLASVLYNKTEGNVRMLCVNTLGVLYILENGDTVRELSDLSGKTIYASGQASTPEYVLTDLLANNGITDTTVEFVGEHAALAAMMANGEIDLCMLPEPNVSAVLLKNQDVRVALDLNDAWAASTGVKLVQGCYIASAAFCEEHPKLVEQFLADYSASAEQVLTSADAAGVVAAMGILPSEAVAAKAIPNCNIVCVTGDEMRSMASEMLGKLFAANPKSVGGALPGDDFYAAAN